MAKIPQLIPVELFGPSIPGIDAHLVAANPVGNPNNATPAWFLDPGNVSGQASDQNDGTSVSSPLLSYGELARRWGTYAPLFFGSVALTWLSSGPVTDPVLFNPILLEGGRSYLLGQPTVVASGHLGAVTAKNRATGQRLQANLGFAVGPHVGRMLTNTTRGGVCFIDADLGGNVALLTQPLASNAPPPPADYSTAPAEVDTFALGDAFTIATVPSVHVLEYTPMGSSFDSVTFTVPAFASHLDNLEPTPGNPGNAQFSFGGVIWSECSFHKTLQTDHRSGDAATLTNVWAAYGGELGRNSQIIGGAYNTLGGVLVLTKNAAVDGDAYLNAGTSQGGEQAIFVLDDVYLGATTEGFFMTVGSSLYSATTSLWGPAHVRVLAHGQLVYPAGQTAVATFLQAGGITLNDKATAYSVSAAGAWTGGIALTPANLDATVAGGGFGGAAIDPTSSATITKGAAT